MPTRDELIALRERVRTATGPDREIDVAVMAAGFPEWAKPEPPFYAPHCIGDEPIYFHAPTWLYKQPCPELSASIDAALALVERVLPDHQVVTWSGVKAYPAMVEIRTGAPEHLVWNAKAATLPFAILSAAIGALIDRGEDYAA